ncbi:MAG: hypothetical protein DCF19_03160 [Pseudanabaena frigida]|uniref:Uncharacterized protein n=1 Tax=Pseudanabaena frigida TaxID=945775 RepID=A0A2W4WGJ0_9CYAN|nr:MAG: hypothetical protein DCF19_03160 [Pseudanabaena frigida]
MYPKNRYIETRIVEFSFNIFLVLVLVTILSVFTSSGWMTVLFLIYFVPLFVFVSFISILIAFGIKYSAHKSLVWVDKYLAYPMLFIQVFVTIFNIGDCGGSSTKVGNFIQRIIHGFILRQVECSESVYPWIRQEIIMGLYVLNLFILAIFIIKTLASSHSKSA